MLARFCDAANLQDFDVIRDLSLDHSNGRNNLVRKMFSVPSLLHSRDNATRRRVEKPGSAANRETYGVKPDAMTRAVCRPGASGSARANTSAAVPRSRPSRKTCASAGVASTMRKLASSKRVDPKQQDPPTPVTTDWPRCGRILEPFAAIAVVEPPSPPLATPPPVTTAGSNGITATAATAVVRGHRFIQSPDPCIHRSC